jgi:hypothetical protein
MPAIHHVHTYSKVNRQLWRCADPYCTHTIARALVKGKASLCRSCGNEFIMNAEAMKRVNPTCVFCGNTAESRKRKRIEGMIKSAFDDAAERAVVSTKQEVNPMDLIEEKKDEIQSDASSNDGSI